MQRLFSRASWRSLNQAQKKDIRSKESRRAPSKGTSNEITHDYAKIFFAAEEPAQDEEEVKRAKLQAIRGRCIDEKLTEEDCSYLRLQNQDDMLYQIMAPYSAGGTFSVKATHQHLSVSKESAIKQLLGKTMPKKKKQIVKKAIKHGTAMEKSAGKMRSDISWTLASIN